MHEKKMIKKQERFMNCETKKNERESKPNYHYSKNNNNGQWISKSNEKKMKKIFTAFENTKICSVITYVFKNLFYKDTNVEVLENKVKKNLKCQMCHLCKSFVKSLLHMYNLLVSEFWYFIFVRHAALNGRN